jgi:hypothetical protein
LSYLQHYLFDGADQGASNDDDGIVDAGETIEVAIVVKNYWGMADNVEVTLEAQADGAVAGPDPYVTWDVPNVNYGGVGSFNEDDNGLIYDEGGLITGVRVPFRFTVAENTPNEHIIPMLVTMTAKNGLDPNDSKTYTTTSRFNLIVQRGRELPRVIDSDAAGTDGGLIDTDGVEDGVVTIDDSTLWLVDNPVLIASGTTLKVGPGATLQFWGTQPDDLYAVFEASFMQIEGHLSLEGTESNPVTFKPSDLFPSRAVRLDVYDPGRISAIYSRLYNVLSTGNSSGAESSGYPAFDVLDHTEIKKIRPESRVSWWDEGWVDAEPTIKTRSLTNSRLSRLGLESAYGRGLEGTLAYDGRRFPMMRGLDSGSSGSGLTAGHIETSLIENTALGWDLNASMDGVVLLNPQTYYVNRYGENVTVGSLLSLSAAHSVSRAVIADVFTHDGASYVLAWPGDPTESGFLSSYDRSLTHIEKARSFAQTLSGDLLVYSSDTEADALKAYYQDFFESYENLANVLSICDEFPEICEKVRDERFDWWYELAIGLKTDGAEWQWVTGETPNLQPGNDPLTSSNLGSPEFSAFPYAMTYFDRLGDQYIFSTSTDYTDVTLVILEIPGEFTREEVQSLWDTHVDETGGQLGIKNSSILNPWWDPNPAHWLTLEAEYRSDSLSPFNKRNSIDGVYWGTDSSPLIENSLLGYSRDFNRLPIVFEPILSAPSESAYPHVATFEILDAAGNPRADQRFASEETLWRRFNLLLLLVQTCPTPILP